MPDMNRVLAIIMAGGAGERLQPLTGDRSKAAVPFGGKFRLIDFTLSNCLNSGLRRIYILTQYLSDSLNRHIQDGWGISIHGLGEFIYCVPAQQKLGSGWYSGTADAVRQNLNLIKVGDFDYVLVLSGDHIYKMDYSRLLDYHKMKDSSVTVCGYKIKKEQAAGRLGVLEADPDYKLIGFEEKPPEPKTIPEDPDYALASMGIYMFKVNTLIDELGTAKLDFGQHVLPVMVDNRRDLYVYDYINENRISDFETRVNDGIREKLLVYKTHDSTYWRDVGTIDSYYESSMDLLEVDPDFSLYGERWPFRTYQRLLPPSKYVIEGKARQSIVCDGCIISGGAVWGSILSPGVIVEKDALIEQSIIFDDVIIEPGARIRRAIIDKKCRIQAGASVGYDKEADKKKDSLFRIKESWLFPRVAP